jgi:hypothetical protein
LERLPDKYEGTLPEIIRLAQANISKLFSNGETHFNYPDDVLKVLQATTLVNTWHINEVESGAMWDLYSNKNAGIALQSTYKRLSGSFINNKEDVIWIGKVKYIDCNKDLSGFINIFNAITSKRSSFQHEIELRAFTSLLGYQYIENLLDWNEKIITSNEIPNISKADIETYGKYVLTELDTLIERIYVSPLSQKWHYELVKSIAEKYGINKEKIIRSDL